MSGNKARGTCAHHSHCEHARYHLFYDPETDSDLVVVRYGRLIVRLAEPRPGTIYLREISRDEYHARCVSGSRIPRTMTHSEQVQARAEHRRREQTV